MPILRTLIPLHHAGADLVPGELFAASDAEAASLLASGWVQPVGVPVSVPDLTPDVAPAATPAEEAAPAPAVRTGRARQEQAPA